MFRPALAIAAGSSAVALLTAPVALADTKKFRAVYSDEVDMHSPPAPGSISAGNTQDNAVARVESKLDQLLKTEKINVEGVTYNISKLFLSQVRCARGYVNDTLDWISDNLAKASNAAIGGERSVMKTLSGLRAPHEDALPATVYILVSALTGSIVARRRNLFVRLVAPWAFGAAVFAYTMPDTFKNTRDLIWRYEQKASPQLAEAHANVSQKVEELKVKTIHAVDEGEKQLEHSVTGARKALKDWTGIDLNK